MAEAVFLSAGVPDSKRAPRHAASADVVAITSAVSALVHVTLGRRILVWGGHPAITPMVWEVAESLGVEYGGWVRLYQSQHFRDEYPEDNQRFQNVTYTDDVDHDRQRSLDLLRERMFSDFRFCCAVFIGGMEGVIHEFELLKRMQPKATMLPVVSTGGATHDIASLVEDFALGLRDDLDYVMLFHRLLGIDVRETRYSHPNEQPANASDRYWKRKP